VYTLPSEVMWEAAARGFAGREYAYEGAYDNGRCNTFESHIWGTTPVGVFPQGCTPTGIHDMSGNVWEWTTTLWGKSFQNPDFRYPYVPDDGRENLEDGVSRRVLRGGSWNDDALGARAAYRNFIRPDSRDRYLGFRVGRVRCSPSH
jgi:formylglycine-generating enzyme required for sulfatase activity